MAKTRLSDSFKVNLFICKILRIWQGRTSSKLYMYYSITFLFITFFLYTILLTLNLTYTPGSIELMICELTFFFTEITIAGKIFMLIYRREQILQAFDILDCEIFTDADDDIAQKILKDGVKAYSIAWKLYTVLAHCSYSFRVLLPTLAHFIFNTELDLPICKYYFLSEQSRDDYFVFWFIYQNFLYFHMTYAIHLDSLVNGMIFMAIVQLRIVNHKLRTIGLGPLEQNETEEVREQILYTKLIQCLKHYDAILNYIFFVQEAIDIPMFIQFGVATVCVSVILCGLCLIKHSSTESAAFMLIYLIIMAGETFVPAWFGTSIIYESRELAFAAYNSNWIVRPMKFKRSLILFVERANIPITITGLKIFPLALESFTSVMKFSYSSLALVRSIQDKETQI